MAKREMAAYPAVLRRLERLRKRRDPVGAWRLVAVLVPVCVACSVENSADVTPWYLKSVLAVFAALLPLLVIAWLATVVVSLDDERRARRSRRSRQRAAYLLLAMGWVTAGGASGLAAWAAGARSTGPGVGEDWIATGLVWSTMICLCATIMMVGCALTVIAPHRWQ
jgi:hypothetical protein